MDLNLSNTVEVLDGIDDLYLVRLGIILEWEVIKMFEGDSGEITDSHVESGINQTA